MKNPDVAEALERADVLMGLRKYLDENQSLDIIRYVIQMHDALLKAKAPLDSNQASLIVSIAVKELGHQNLPEVYKFITSHIFVHLKKISSVVKENIEMILSQHYAIVSTFKHFKLELDVWSFLKCGKVDPFLAKLMTPFTDIYKLEVNHYEQAVNTLKAQDYERKQMNTHKLFGRLGNLNDEEFGAQEQFVISTLLRASQETQGPSQYLVTKFDFNGKLTKHCLDL